MRRAERGVALILALLIVALAAVIATHLFSLTGSSIARQESLARALDSSLLAQGLEDYALVDARPRRRYR